MYSNQLHFSNTNKKIKQKPKVGCFSSLTIPGWLQELVIKEIAEVFLKHLITPSYICTTKLALANVFQETHPDKLEIYNPYIIYSQINFESSNIIYNQNDI